jgi:hypothetical protein
MVSLLPQQRLILELLVMSGEIAVPATPDDSILWRTVDECLGQRWIVRREVGGGFCKVDATPIGRSVLGKDKAS